MLVTKSVPPERVREAFEAGARDFGENRVQEFLRKKNGLPSGIHWHFQGGLQTNKVKPLLGEITLLHSLDRTHLAEEIQKQAEKKSLTVEALVQVNTSGEATQSGFGSEEVSGAVDRLRAFSQIRLRGLMTIGPFTDDAARVRACFRKLRDLRDRLKKQFPEIDWGHLSMGMSSDFEIAIEEGATIVRVGTAVFGERKNHGETQ